MPRIDFAGSPKRYTGVLAELLASVRLTVVIVVAFILLCIAGAMLPQVGASTAEGIEAWQEAHGVVTWFAEPLGLFEAFSSTLFIVVMVALAVNLVACTTRRMLRSRRAQGPARIALLGSLVLHVGLLVLLLGGALTAGLTVDGRVAATEGQTLDLSFEQSYLSLQRGAWASDTLPGLLLSLVASEPVTVEGVLASVASHVVLQVPEEEPLEATLGINQPVRAGGTILTHADWGYSPLLTAVSPEGQVVLDAYVALSSTHGRDSGIYQDVVSIPDEFGTIMVRLLPDLRYEGGEPVSATLEPRNPAVEIDLLDEEGEVTDSGLAVLGSQVGVGGYNFVFGDLRGWTGMRVRSDAGRVVVYAGFFLGFLGLLLRYAFDVRRVMAGIRRPLEDPDAADMPGFREGPASAAAEDAEQEEEPQPDESEPSEPESEVDE